MRRWLAQSRRKFVVVLVVLRWSLRWGWRGLAGGALGLQLLELRCKRLCTARRGWLSQLLLGLFLGLASAAALTSAVVAALAPRRAVRAAVFEGLLPRSDFAPLWPRGHPSVSKRDMKQ